jgi:hypothetical protein
MGYEPTLYELEAITNEALYRRLEEHILNFPNPLPIEDYVYRCDVWEMVNKALRAEIARRVAPPPPWWPAPRENPPSPRRRPCLTAIGIYVGALALAAGAGALIHR